jgi:very-short-patch-repair endonuclease
MSGAIDLVRLRQLVGGVVATLGDYYTHEKLSEACERLGLPEPPGRDEGTKRQRVETSFAALTAAALPGVAERILVSGEPPQPDAATRNAIQDVLWAGQGAIEIPKRTRREIARDLDLGDLTFKPDQFMALLDRLWVLGTPLDPWSEGSSGLRARIDRHVFRNPGDWSAEDLFEELGAFEAGDARFGKFLEGLACADVIPDEPAQRRVAAVVNPHLRSAGAELGETGTDGGYPVFSLISTRPGRTRQPKNLIFASPVKPDIRFRDAVDNDIEIVANADKVLVYDRKIDDGGLRWRDLQAWWKDTKQIADDDEAKRTLYRRLLSSLPGNSPPQRNLFALYHEIYGTTVRDLPALLPEVWLHWDYKTARERGRDALLRFRMDFLLLLPHGQRVVLEVDGVHHYASPGGERPDPARYADGVRGDRDLKLSGYEVFRFGAAELQGRDQARDVLRPFFRDLLRRFGVSVPAAGPAP